MVQMCRVVVARCSILRLLCCSIESVDEAEARKPSSCMVSASGRAMAGAITTDMIQNMEAQVHTLVKWLHGASFLMGSSDSFMLSLFRSTAV